MNCHATRAVLDLHAENRLSARRTKSVVEHLASCAECRALAAPPAPSLAKLPASGFKARLAAAMKAERKGPEPRPTPRYELALWPRDLSEVAVAAAALVLVAVIIGWSGVPSQRDLGGDELVFGRMP